MRKPVIVVIGKEFGYYSHFAEKYRFLFFEPVYVLDPFVQAEEIVGTLKGMRVDGVVGFHDLASLVAGVVAERLRLVGPSPRSLYLTQNKAVFSRRLLEAGLPHPETVTIDIFEPLEREFTYPVFIKPIKGRLSSFAYMVCSREEWEEVLRRLRIEERELDGCFERFFAHFSREHVPLRSWYQVQPFIDERQFTVDGFVREKKVILVGITESIYTEDRKSFVRFDFPGRYPEELPGRLQGVLERLVEVLEFDHGGFNVEFFLRDTGEINLIEMNTRISQGFNWLYWQRYRQSHLEMAFEVALGRAPDLSVREGSRRASSFPLRVGYDCVVRRLPSAEEIEELQRGLDIARIEFLVEEGQRLSECWQDAYSFRYALVDIGGESMEEIEEKYRLLMERMDVGLERVVGE